MEKALNFNHECRVKLYSSTQFRTLLFSAFWFKLG
jgi:hypothetical protein